MELHYFLTTNGSAGHTSYLDKASENCRDVILLSGYPRPLAAALIRECYAIAKQNRMRMDIIHNCLDNSMEGIILPELQTALLNLPVYEPRTDLASLFKNEALSLYHTHLQKAFRDFAKAKEIHDEWEKIYISATDYQVLDQFTEETAASLLADHKTNHRGSLCDRFFGSATINGSVDYIDALSADTKRYFIKGRPGTGKSTFLKKLALSACDRGYHVERYHCSFDPNSLDMVVIRELGICLFDSTAPHEYFPSKASDEILDLYAVAVRPDTDTRFQAELADVSARYKSAIGSATKHLIAANEACIRAEDDYRTLIDEDNLMAVRKTVVERLFP
ncbi:MAG: hypothetical protein ACI4QW_04590 [Clostridia bacterium]